MYPNVGASVGQRLCVSVFGKIQSHRAGGLIYRKPGEYSSPETLTSTLPLLPLTVSFKPPPELKLSVSFPLPPTIELLPPEVYIVSLPEPATNVSWEFEKRPATNS